MVSTSRKSTGLLHQNGAEGNEIPDQRSSNMKVVVRVRPQNSLETSQERELTTSVRVMDQNVLVFDPNEECDSINLPGSYRKVYGAFRRRARDLRFIFDRVFDEKSTNADVFEDTTKAITEGVLDGYNCTVFAYGATGAGKTYTMLGNTANPGVMFLTMMDLYQRIHEMKDEKTCDVAVSYLEVYNETICDLLLPGSPLAVREDPQRGVCVSGLTLHKPRTAEELLGMLEFGNHNRTQHPTDANAQSSRSHAVFQVFVRQKDRTAGLHANIRLAKMSLIDLAGSERATVTTNRGARFREGANINRSLLALGNCINALADNENKAGHIPYRDSKLTRLLKDSLGGNCRTVMIAAVSPSSLSYEDTYNTLKYADRAKHIKVNLKRNVVSVDFHVIRYAKIVDELRIEITELKSKLSQYEAGKGLPPAVKTGVTVTGRGNEEVQRPRARLRSIMTEREMIKKDMVDIEAAQRDLFLKSYRKERNLERIQLLCLQGDRCEKAVLKTQKCLSVTKTKKKKLQTRFKEAEQKLQKNTECLDRAKVDMKALGDENKDAEERLLSCQSTLKAELECAELRRQCRYFKKYAHAQEKDAHSTERLVEKLLAAVKKQFFLLKGAGLATPEISGEYDVIANLIIEGREVSWADVSEAENSNIIDFNAVADGTPIRTTTFNTPTIARQSITPVDSMTCPEKLMTPRHFESIATRNKSPVFKDTRVSLSKEFDAVTSPMLPQRVGSNTGAALASSVSNHGPILSCITNMGQSRGQNSAVTTPVTGCLTNIGSRTTPLLDSCGNPAPLRLVSQRNQTSYSKVAWAHLPIRIQDDRSPLLSRSGRTPEMFSSPAPLTPNTQTEAQLSSSKAPTFRIGSFTPLRELSGNCKQTIAGLHSAGLPSMYDTPSKKAKISEKAAKKSGAKVLSSAMMPKRNIAVKENTCPTSKPLRKSSSTVNLRNINPQRVQKHLSGLKRAMSTSALTSSIHFAPRTTHDASNQHRRPRWQ